MKTKFNGILTLLLAFVVQISFAQEKTITGTVVDETNMPLPGATVLIKGTTTGASTDFDGKYSISANKGDVLTFSYVGYADQNITIGASSKIDISLILDEALEEVVIQAYRTTSKETSNIAATTVTASTIEGRPNGSFVQTLQGQVAGLNITTGNGQPGGNSTINIRGVGSLSGNTEPLFIIDGIPVDEDNFRSLNPNDIESLSVLKDAGATAIYGNRGANGAVVITTKRGSFNSPLKVTYQGNTSISRLQSNSYDLMNSREQLQLEKDYGSGYGATLSDTELALRANQTNTDWLDVFFGTALSQSHTINFQSGGENLNSFTSFGYSNIEGILKEASTLKRFNFRNNTNGKSENGKFKYGTALSINYSESNEPNSIGSGAINRNFVLGANQSVPYISPDSYYEGEGSNIPVVFANTPLFLLDRRDTYTRREDEIKILANVNASYEINDYLSAKSSFGIDFTDEQLLRVEAPYSFNSALFAEAGNTTPGFSNQNSVRSARFNMTNSLTYKRTFAEKHNFEASLFTEYFKAHYRSFGARQNGFDPKTFYPGDGAAFIDDNADNDNFVDVATATIRNAGLFSYFGFLDYDYDKRFGFSGTLRRDASYRFSQTNRWGTFWSVSGRWNISNESFMSNTAINELKLRGSYGTSGNQDIESVSGQFAPFNAPDRYLDTYATGGAYGGVNGLSVGQIGNSDLKWETITQANIGIDFGVWNSRLRGAIDVYKKNTTDLFLNAPIAPSLNAPAVDISANIGELENRGVDLELHYDLFRAKKEGDLNITLNFVGNYNKQEFINLGPNGDIPYGNRVGGVIGEIYAAPYVGVNPANGNALFLDINDNITEDITDTDQRATGKNIFPDTQGSFGVDIDYKRFFFTTQFNYVTGVDRYDFDYSSFMDPTSIGQFRHSRDILDAWSAPGDVTSVPSLNATNLDDFALSDRDIRSADYLRLRFVQLGYNLPKSLLKRIGFTNAKVFVSGENLLTFSEWRGFDAEALNSGGSNGYPTPKTYSFGLEFGF